MKTVHIGVGTETEDQSPIVFLEIGDAFLIMSPDEAREVAKSLIRWADELDGGHRVN